MMSVYSIMIFATTIGTLSRLAGESYPNWPSVQSAFKHCRLIFFTVALGTVSGVDGLGKFTCL